MVSPTVEKPEGAVVRVYWRPGCPYCSLLRRGLKRSGLAYEEINVWDDPEAAAYVRSVNGGNETVPTVVVADRTLTNPSAREVLDRVRAHAPEHLPPARPAQAPWWRRLLGGQA